MAESRDEVEKTTPSLMQVVNFGPPEARRSGTGPFRPRMSRQPDSPGVQG